MCTISIEQLIGIDENGNGQRDAILVIGLLEDCSSPQLAIFSGSMPDNAQVADGDLQIYPTVLPAGQSAYGMTPTTTQHIFTARFSISEASFFKGACDTALPPNHGFLVVCREGCSDRRVWLDPIPCERVESECPDISLTVGDEGVCQRVGQNWTREVSFSIVVAPFVTGETVKIEWGHDNASEIYELQAVSLPSVGVTIGQSTISHSFPTSESGSTNYIVKVSVVDRSDCSMQHDVEVSACPPPQNCPEKVSLRVSDSTGTDVTGDVHPCLEPGRYVIKACVHPAGSAITFLWNVDGEEAVPGQRGVLAVAGEELTLDLDTADRSVSVVVFGQDKCRAQPDGIDLRPCPETCCPDLTGLSATCIDPCVEATMVTLTAQGSDLHCAEIFDWEFGDGSTAETATPAVTHTYPRGGRFTATVVMVRPTECDGRRVQRDEVTVSNCPRPSHCRWLAILTAFLLLAFLALLPLIACVGDAVIRRWLIIILIVVIILLVIVWLWWLLDPCCRPTRCDLMRILFWVFSWALVVVAVVGIGGWCVSVIPFGVVYVVIQQSLLRQINNLGCAPAPDIFSWPFED